LPDHHERMAPSVNISLIGMPGAGKSTIGVLLAKAISWNFVDIDLLIQVAEERTLQEIIRSEGIERFIRIEQRHTLIMDRRQHVIATGGSVVYGAAAMEHLRSLGTIVHLDVPLPTLENRLENLNGRGVIMGPGQTLHGIFQQRQPLYQHYADVTIDCANRTQDEIVDGIIARLT